MPFFCMIYILYFVYILFVNQSKCKRQNYEKCVSNLNIPKFKFIPIYYLYAYSHYTYNHK